MSTRRKKFHKARMVKQTQFDQQLMRVEQLVHQFHELIQQQPGSQKYCDATYVKLYDIRLKHLPEAVQSLEWTMKKAQMREFPMEANGL